ncbi:MAG: bifunctional riboflavin kinase/FAD synthetase [Lachnospiraceae bacterium]|nr:bifunctional riboflavin kinase/FAD synthetase [Lachnospiraceae bacterium]
MELICNSTQFQLEKPSAVAIGKFDGMHLGHQFLLRKLSDTAKELTKVVFTFDPSPAVFFSGEALPSLFTREEKREVFRTMGIDVLIEFPLNKETASTPPEAFLKEILHERLRAKRIVAGEDLSFGRHGAGDFTLLNLLAKTYGYETELVEKIRYRGEEISSSRIREAVLSSRMEEAAAMLGTPYRLEGSVIHGRHLGHTLGFPTINLRPPADKLLPPFGVYRSLVHVEENTYRALTNIGVKPTVGAGEKAGAESYLYDYEGDLYGKRAVVELISFLRPEQRFASLDALKAQLQSDIARGRQDFSFTMQENHDRI